jgi:hypothetical protein
VELFVVVYTVAATVSLLWGSVVSSSPHRVRSVKT